MFIPLKALPIAKFLFTFTECLADLKIVTKRGKPAKTARGAGMGPGCPAVALSRRQEERAGKGAWWELCTDMGCAVCASCSVSRAANSVCFTCTGSLGGRNQRKVGGMSTQTLAAGGTPPPPPFHYCWPRRGRRLCPLLPFSQKECMCLGASCHALLPC